MMHLKVYNIYLSGTMHRQSHTRKKNNCTIFNYHLISICSPREIRILILYSIYLILFFSKESLLHTSCDILRTMPASPQRSSAPWLHCRADCAWFHGDCNHGCHPRTVRILRTPSSGPSAAACSCSARCLTSASTHHGLPANNPFKYKSQVIISICFVMNCFLGCFCSSFTVLRQIHVF